MSMSVDVDVEPTQVLRVLGEPLRWRIVTELAAEELCVCHLVEALEVPQPLVSHHLRVLRDAGLVEASKYRYWTYYRLLPDGLAAIARHIGDLVTGVPEPGARRRPCC